LEHLHLSFFEAKNIGVQESKPPGVTSIDLVFIKELEDDNAMEEHFVEA
jgi:hypothetical protein